MPLLTVTTTSSAKPYLYVTVLLATAEKLGASKIEASGEDIYLTSVTKHVSADNGNAVCGKARAACAVDRYVSFVKCDTLRLNSIGFARVIFILACCNCNLASLSDKIAPALIAESLAKA